MIFFRSSSPPSIVLHRHPRPHRFDHDTFIAALRSVLPEDIHIEERPPLFETVVPADVAQWAATLGRTRVLDPFRRPHPRVVCSVLEQADEQAILDGERAPIGRPPPEGVLYDAGELMAAARTRIPDNTLDKVHIVLTDRLFGTFDRRDGRYHARVVLAAGPHLISTAGIVEAPARPRGFYAAQASGVSRSMLESSLADEVLVHGDPRIPQFLAGYALQAFFWQAFGEAFCGDPDCSLFNAHWQSEVMRAQADGPRLCDAHARMLSDGGPVTSPIEQRNQT